MGPALETVSPVSVKPQPPGQTWSQKWNPPHDFLQKKLAKAASNFVLVFFTFQGEGGKRIGRWKISWGVLGVYKNRIWKKKKKILAKKNFFEEKKIGKKTI